MHCNLLETLSNDFKYLNFVFTNYYSNCYYAYSHCLGYKQILDPGKNKQRIEKESVRLLIE